MGKGCCGLQRPFLLSGGFHLILYHTEDKNIKNRKTLYLKELETVFRGKAFVPDDLEVISIE